MVNRLKKKKTLLNLSLKQLYSHPIFLVKLNDDGATPYPNTGFFLKLRTSPSQMMLGYCYCLQM